MVKSLRICFSTKEVGYVASVTTADGNTTTKYEDVASAISDAVSAGKNLAIGECQHNSVDADMKCEYCGKDFSGSEAMPHDCKRQA
ncbi:MAG: hypothetical protein ACLUEU_01335 [Oscillospiraceae bacterium]